MLGLGSSLCPVGFRGRWGEGIRDSVLVFCYDDLMSIKPKVGRPPKRAADGSYPTMTVRLPAQVKNWLVDQAAAFDMTLTEFLIMLAERNAR